jgi:Fic family protein
MSIKMSPELAVYLTENYPHISFTRNWRLSDPALRLIGECKGIIKAICNTPILPKYRENLMQVALIRGAQSTTAIEGNTLTETEVQNIKNGKALPPSKEYMEKEVKNILNAFAEIFEGVIYKDESGLVTTDLIKNFHRLVGDGLNENFDSEIGKYRSDNRIVGRYRCPDYIYVEELMNCYCEWLRHEFHYESGEQRTHEIIEQAIVAHIYLEWIHPFGDGNGRTGRLLEFYILLRGKIPDIALHILSSFYNSTRAEYYRQIEAATLKRDISGFIQYALLGFRDGLQVTLDTIHESNFDTTWRRFVYDTFEDLVHDDQMKRKRRLVLDMERDKSYSIKTIVLASPRVARDYATISERTVYREIDELMKLHLILKETNGQFRANTDILKNYTAIRKE